MNLQKLMSIMSLASMLLFATSLAVQADDEVVDQEAIEAQTDLTSTNTNSTRTHKAPYAIDESFQDEPVRELKPKVEEEPEPIPTDVDSDFDDE